jgi:type III restriction enzyme
MSEVQQQIPIQPVEQPVICSPYEEPDAHWDYDKTDGSAVKTGGRRPAGYWYQTKKVGTKDQELFEEFFQEENFDDLPLINLLREDVRRWRESGYRGATNVTKELLNWWRSPSRSRPLFFCQLEAVETLIYLAEIRIPGRASKTGFRKFALSEANLQRLLKGERPEDEGEIQLDRADGRTKTFHPFAKLADANFFPTLVDLPLDSGLLPLRRMGSKMATGSGKTVVMSLLISWAFCNRGVNPSSTEFPNGVLVCCPNLTVKERLKVLRPEDPDNYYAAFDLVPVNLRPHLQKGKVVVENWHRFAPESEHKEGDKSYAVVNKGPETAETLSRRVLGDLYDRLPIMVLNDEGHHCWRPAPADQQIENVDTSRKGRKKRDDLTREEAKEIEEEANEARVWLQGLDSINNCLKDKPGIAYCVDLSATPFYIKGSGFSEGQPFPWLVSDFGLVDAIESGITKIPRIPVKDESGREDEAGRPDPKYFRLWRHIVDELKKVGETFQSGKPKPEACYREAEGALIQLSDQWKQKFDLMKDASPNQEHIPPVMIVVCDNTQIADFFYKKISGESESDTVTLEDIEDLEDEDEDESSSPKKKGKKQIVYGTSAIKPEFSNTKDRKYTIRIDVDMLRKAESDDPGITKQKAEEELRRLIATVGKRGEPGEHVRCVVSVAMLTEGWDANNVTHILGIRAFGSQLLCEQVVGRGLRRMNYHPEPDENGKLLLPPEYVDVYGIPFTVIPYKGKPVDQPSPEDKPKNRVWAVPDREEMEIRFPYVDGYVFQLTKGILRCDFDKIEDRIAIEPEDEPTATYLSPAAGYVDTPKQARTGFEYVKQDRQAYYNNTHFQTILFLITTEIINDLQDAGRPKTTSKEKVMALQSRHQLFPQVYGFVQRFVKEFVDYNGVDPRELGLQRYTTRIKELLSKVIYPDDDAGEPPLVPVINRYRPMGSTGLVDFVTTRPTVPSARSHINSVVLHSNWEGDAATVMDAPEAEPIVSHFARNDHLGLTIPYEHLEVTHKYEPDFLVRLTNGVTVLTEIKGHEHTPEQNNAKHQAARRWVSAVNNMKDEVFGQWDFLVCRDVELLLPALGKLVGKTVPPYRLKKNGQLDLNGG